MHRGGSFLSNGGIYVTIGLSRGGLAQLGERFNGIEEVSGSIPLSSTRRCMSAPQCPRLAKLKSAGTRLQRGKATQNRFDDF